MNSNCTHIGYWKPKIEFKTEHKITETAWFCSNCGSILLKETTRRVDNNFKSTKK